MRSGTRSCVALAFGVLLLACGGEAGNDAEVPAATPPAATPPPPPAALSLTEVAGQWNVRVMSENSDSTLVTFVMNVTPDTSGWTMTFPDREAIPMRVLAVEGDSIVTEAGPFQSALRSGMNVTTHSVMRLQGGSLVGETTARYETTGADSVVVLRTEGTRM